VLVHLGTPAWQIVVRTLVVYFVVLAGLRLFGKRQLGQMNIADLVMILLIANAVQNAMVGPDVSLPGGLVAAVVLLAVNYLVTRALSRSREAQRLLEGAPTLLVKDGDYVLQGLLHEGIAKEEVQMAIREHGIADASEVRAAYLEPDGTISVVPMSAQILRGRRRVRQIKKH
jgi:uncharacterized membrane protein YcaP (DUF421 family)